MNISAILRSTETLLTHNSPHILTAIGASGVVVTGILAAKGAYKAGYNDYLTYDQSPTFAPSSAAELVEDHWRKFIPAAVAGTITVTAIIAANRVGTRRTAAIATAYAISERAYSEYREKVAEKLTAPKYQQIDDEIAAERLERADDERNRLVVMGGEQLCYDLFSDRYFKSTMEDLKHAQNAFFHEVLNDGYASLTNYYQRIGLGGTEFSDQLGWEANGKEFDIEYGAHLSLDSKPCITIRFTARPTAGYSTFG